MRKALYILNLLFALVVLGSSLEAQVPTSCFEIESLLVDACTETNSCGDLGSPACGCEGKNEMFRFVVGPNDLNTADMDVDWPNGFNDWQGVCQNGATAGIVQELNATIINCGWLVEPIGGVLPAGKKVLMITSTDMCVSANSFSGLSDTLVIIFQCTGNYYGHFANYNDSGNNLRTIEVEFGPGCFDDVTYDRSELVDIAGVNQAADGARVDFDWGDNPTYVNDGCNAPITQAEFDAGPNLTFCLGDVIAFDAAVSSQFDNVFWSGGAGIFSDITDLNATYTIDPADGDEIVITLNADGCDGPITDELIITNESQSLTGISTSGATAICTGQTLTLTAEGTGLFEWSTSVIAPSIQVSSAGTYTVTASNTCGTESESITITEEPLPTVEISNFDVEELCDGQNLTLDASANFGLIEWSTMETGQQITVQDEGWYYAMNTNDCATAIDSIQLVIIPDPTVAISTQGPISLCEGATVQLEASANGPLSWSTTETSNIITVDQPGTYLVQTMNDCGTAHDDILIEQGGLLPIAAITASDDLMICPGESITLTGSGEGLFEWSDMSSNAELLIDEIGTYILTVTNECGIDQASVSVVMDGVPSAQVLGGPDFAICNGASVQVMASTIGSPTWSDGSTSLTNSFAQAGAYYVAAAAACGTDTAHFQVVIESIEAELSANPIAGDSPLEVHFINETTNAQQVEWDYGDGDIGFGQESDHTYTIRGEFNAVMTVATNLGCEDNANIIISVGACPFSLYIPNAFTPDADGINDQITVMGECINSFEWHIFDRWGREVFTSENIESRWNATDIAGYAVTDGEYPYWLKVTDENGEVHKFEGSITILR